MERAELGRGGAVVGTLPYMSPEQCRGEPATPASDLYALGCMMFQLLSGQLPFVGSPGQMIRARLGRQPPRVERRVAGVPEELAAICGRLLARDAGARPSLREVREALGRSGGPKRERESGSSSPAREQAFIGRREELAELCSHLRLAGEGAPQWVLVAGESGIGKSSLAAVLAGEAERLGFLCVSGRCYEREQVPFVAFDRAIDALIGKLAAWPLEQRAPLRESLELLRPVFPGVGVLCERRSDDGLAVGSEPSPRQKYQLAAAGLCNLVEGCQAQAPLFLMLDDLQWADVESIELLAALLARRRGRVLILGLSRPEGLAAERPLHRLLPQAARVLSLSGLRPAEVAQLAAAVTGEELEPTIAQAVLRRSEGNPFLALQLSRYLAALAPIERQGVLASPALEGSWLDAATRALSARAEQLLSTAATVGGDVARSLLRAASGLSSADFDLALGELLSARLLKALPGAASAASAASGGAAAEADNLERLDLYHDRIRENAYERLAPERRRALHRSLALGLEAATSTGGPPFEALLHHWTGAGDRDKRRHFAGKAAEQAAEKLAFRRAAQLLRSLLEDPEPGEPPLRTAARWERVGDLCESGGQLGEACAAYQQALRIWETAPCEAEQRRIGLLHLRGRIAESLMATRRIAEGRAVYEVSLAELGLRFERHWLVHLLIIVGLRLRIALRSLLPQGPRREPSPFEREELLFWFQMVRAVGPIWVLSSIEAMARFELLSQKLHDGHRRMEITVNEANVAVFLGPVSERRFAALQRLLDDAQAVAETHRVPFSRETIQRNRAFLWLTRDHARARRECEAALSGFAQRGMADAYDSVVARNFYVMILYCQGDWDGALRAIEREEAVPDANIINLVTALGFAASILAHRGQCAEAEAALGRARAALVGVPLCQLTLFPEVFNLSLLVAKGEFALALESFDRLLPALRQAGVPLIGFVRLQWETALLEASLGLARQGKLTATRRAHAQRLARRFTRRGMLDTPCLGHRALALFAYIEGRTASAQRSLAQALWLSRNNTGPHRRWLCLLAAAELGVATPELLSETAALAARHRFVPPPREAR